MSEIERRLKDFEEELLKVIEKFEKEHGLLMVDVKYDGFNKSVTYTFAGENFKFTKTYQ